VAPQLAVLPPTAAFTVLLRVHVCPPMLKAKFAVPLLEVVPLMV
jgi:hypothetical protein